MQVFEAIKSLENLLEFVQKWSKKGIPPSCSTSDTLTNVCKSEAQTRCICSRWENKPRIWSCVWNKARGDAYSRDRTAEISGESCLTLWYSTVLSCEFTLSSHRETCTARVSVFTLSVIKDYSSHLDWAFNVCWLINCTQLPYIILYRLKWF